MGSNLSILQWFGMFHSQAKYIPFMDALCPVSEDWCEGTSTHLQRLQLWRGYTSCWRTRCWMGSRAGQPIWGPMIWYRGWCQLSRIRVVTNIFNWIPTNAMSLLMIKNIPRDSYDSKYMMTILNQFPWVQTIGIWGCAHKPQSFSANLRGMRCVMENSPKVRVIACHSRVIGVWSGLSMVSRYLKVLPFVGR